jgi:hypothetical protein
MIVRTYSAFFNLRLRSALAVFARDHVEIDVRCEMLLVLLHETNVFVEIELFLA